MRIFVAVVIAVALLTGGALAQGGGKGKKSPQDAPPTEDQAKKKATDEAYKRALKHIPASSEAPDPWKNIR